jgi:hypothetical protein
VQRGCALGAASGDAAHDLGGVAQRVLGSAGSTRLLAVIRSCTALRRRDGTSSISDSSAAIIATLRSSTSTPTTRSPTSANATDSGEPHVSEADHYDRHDGQHTQGLGSNRVEHLE